MPESCKAPETMPESCRQLILWYTWQQDTTSVPHLRLRQAALWQDGLEETGGQLGEERVQLGIDGLEHGSRPLDAVVQVQRQSQGLDLGRHLSCVARQALHGCCIAAGILQQQD